MTHPLTDEEVLRFRRLEEELWQEASRFDRNRMETLLAPDFFEFGGSGLVHRRDAVLSLNPRPINAEFPLPNFRARRLADDVVQVTYDSILNRDGAIEARRRSSIWTRSGAGWVIRFHQGTPFDPA